MLKNCKNKLHGNAHIHSKTSILIILNRNIIFNPGTNGEQRGIEIPQILRGSWFSWEGRPVTTVLDVTKMSNHGKLAKIARNGSDYTMIFKDRNCFYCIKAFTR